MANRDFETQIVVTWDVHKILTDLKELKKLPNGKKIAESYNDVIVKLLEQCNLLVPETINPLSTSINFNLPDNLINSENTIKIPLFQFPQSDTSDSIPVKKQENEVL